MWSILAICLQTFVAMMALGLLSKKREAHVALFALAFVLMLGRRVTAFLSSAEDGGFTAAIRRADTGWIPALISLVLLVAMLAHVAYFDRARKRVDSVRRWMEDSGE